MVGISSNVAAAESVSLFVNISCKFPLCDSRIGDNVKKRGWSLGWVLSGATRVSKEKFSFLSGLEIQPKQTRRFIELSAMKMNPLLLVVIPLFFLSGPYVNAGPVGNFFKKVGQSISKPLQSPSLRLRLSRRALSLRTRRTPRGDGLREQHLRPPQRRPQSGNHHTLPKKKSLLAVCGVFQPRI